MVRAYCCFFFSHGCWLSLWLFNDQWQDIWGQGWLRRRGISRSEVMQLPSFHPILVNKSSRHSCFKLYTTSISKDLDLCKSPTNQIRHTNLEADLNKKRTFFIEAATAAAYNIVAPESNLWRAKNLHFLRKKGTEIVAISYIRPCNLASFWYPFP